MNPYAKYTIGVLIAVALFLAFYDIYIASVSGGDATISWVLWTAAQRYPAIAFGFGFLMGHLFAQMNVVAATYAFFFRPAVSR